MKAIKNKYCQDKDLVVPAQCACCNKCWIYVEPPHKKGRCVFGGPYNGFAILEEKSLMEIKNND